MHAALCRAPALYKAARATRSQFRCSAGMAGGGAAAGLSYPRPVVFDALKEHKTTLIMLHGLGDTAQGWADIAPMLGPELPNTKFLFPTAPMRPITLNGGMVMTGWYDIRALEKLDTESEDAEAMLESKRYIESLVEAEVAAGTPSTSVAVGGFSQGGAMALMMLRSKHKLAGIVGLSSYLLLHDQQPLVSEENQGTPVLMCHGDCDMVVDYRFGQQSYEQLKAAGVQADFKTYQYMGHEACGEELMEMRNFLRRSFSAAAAAEGGQA